MKRMPFFKNPMLQVSYQIRKALRLDLTFVTTISNDHPAQTSHLQKRRIASRSAYQYLPKS